jgi:Ca-activated chloride channel homolog
MAYFQVCYNFLVSICAKTKFPHLTNHNTKYLAMKFLLTVLAALLLLIFIACNERTNTRSTKEQAVQIRDITIVPLQEKDTYRYEPASNGKSSKRTPPVIVADEEAQTVIINQDGIIDEGKATITQKSEEEKNSNTEDYDNIVENKFLATTQAPLSTFSIDVDEAAYSNVRRYLQNGSIPPAGAVRIEEMINYFDYSYPKPANDEQFTLNTEISDCPWNPQHRLVHIGLQGKEIPVENLPAANMVFLVDVSGSMDEPNKLPLVQASMNMLIDQLREKDKVAIVVYAGSAGLVLPSTSGSNKTKIKEAINNLEAGGSTAGGEGIMLAYKVARENFIKEGNNRIILATDGDFNVGLSSDDDMVRLIEKERKSGVFLSVLGYGMGNYKDNKMQQLADKGNGNHSYIDNINEARKVLVNEFGSTLFTIAKDVKIQIEFNPFKVQAYRLIGYENRMLASEDFNDDTKDAGELGSGHTVTALYEIIPVGVKDDFTKSVDALKYQSNDKKLAGNNSNEIMTIKLRYKKPDADISRLITHTVNDDQIALVNTSDNFRFAAAVAEFGLLLRSSEFKQQASYLQVLDLAKSAKGNDQNGYRAEFVQLVQSAGSLAKN